jgi:hypothetical protein
VRDLMCAHEAAVERLIAATSPALARTVIPRLRCSGVLEVTRKPRREGCNDSASSSSSEADSESDDCEIEAGGETHLFLLAVQIKNRMTIHILRSHNIGTSSYYGEDSAT